ncbi:hypothetical protein BK659_23675 [Pseudomonas brassicacearum]|uniref:Uncharacterized protein n=1 Tax=Pseudomonas brassicacearum TaxID=930166 RepID=A0A423GV51_9PSED|nr:hypothetical protein [Pseudomonas brassicacearum]RON01517.1 hypothetical protein BK659_23675 [Pseudomonas brassicacearum]
MSKYFDDELISDLHEKVSSGELRIAREIDIYFEALNSRFPIKSRRLDWAAMPFSWVGLELDSKKKSDAFASFFKDVMLEFGLVGEVVYVGDGATDIAVLGDVEAFVDVLECLVSIPQHHYFLSVDCSWLICFTVGGDMGVVVV